jgi:hypothetical protein
MKHIVRRKKPLAPIHLAKYQWDNFLVTSKNYKTLATTSPQVCYALEAYMLTNRISLKGWRIEWCDETKFGYAIRNFKLTNKLGEIFECRILKLARYEAFR